MTTISSNRYKNFIFRCLLLLSAMLFVSQHGVYAQNYQVIKSEKTVKQKGKIYYKHKVIKGNTLFNLSETYGVSKNDIINSNPELKGSSLPLGKEIFIPYGKAPTKVATIYHITQSGETLFSIAKAYNSSVEEIKQLNSSLGNTLSVGQYIRVPQRSHIQPQAEKHNSALNKKDNRVFHIIRPKENLYTISKQWGVSVKELRLHNQLKTHHIKAFDTLWIPVKTKVQPIISIEEKPFVNHYVQSGETLYSIARYYAVSVKDINIYNQINNNRIKSGQVLKIPRKANKNNYIVHIVQKRKERLSSIAKQYIVPLKKLKALNPQLGNKVEQGTEVLIPLAYVEADYKKHTVDTNTKPDANIVEDTEVESTQEDEIENINDTYNTDCKPQYKQIRPYTISLLLPLELDEMDNINLNLRDTTELYNYRKNAAFKFIEFYEGALLAARELAEQGMNFTLKVVDIPRNATDVNQRLRTENIQNSDLIINLLYTKEFEQLASYAKANHIPIVNAVSKRRKILDNNPYVYKVQANELALYQKVANYLQAKHTLSNIIIVRNNAYELSRDYDKLNSLLKKKMPSKIEIPNISLSKKYQILENQIDKNASSTNKKEDYRSEHIWQLFKSSHPQFDIHRIQANANKSTTFARPIHTIIYDENGLDKIVKVLNPLCKNIIIGLSNEEVFAIELFTKLNYLDKSLDIEVLGLPHWDEFEKLDANYTQKLDLQIVSDTHIDYQKATVQSFVQRFRTAFGTEPLPQRYAFLGYDISLYFMTALKYYGQDFAKCLPTLQLPLLERSFLFQKTSIGGNENTHWQILKQQDYIYKAVY